MRILLSAATAALSGCVLAECTLRLLRPIDRQEVLDSRLRTACVWAARQIAAIRVKPGDLGAVVQHSVLVMGVDGGTAGRAYAGSWLKDIHAALTRDAQTGWVWVPGAQSHCGEIICDWAAGDLKSLQDELARPQSPVLEAWRHEVAAPCAEGQDWILSALCRLKTPPRYWVHDGGASDLDTQICSVARESWQYDPYSPCCGLHRLAALGLIRTLPPGLASAEVRGLAEKEYKKQCEFVLASIDDQGRLDLSMFTQSGPFPANAEQELQVVIGGHFLEAIIEGGDSEALANPRTGKLISAMLKIVVILNLSSADATTLGEPIPGVPLYCPLAHLGHALRRL